MAAMAMMAVMAGNSERRAAATDRGSASASTKQRWANAVQKGPMRSAKCADKMASGKRTLLFTAVITICFERIISQNGSNGSDTNCGILP
eukprot:82460-Prymnesium_polylepis.1